MISIDRHLGGGRYLAGFNMVELMVVMVLVGILAVNVLPKVDSAFGVKDTSWYDELMSALRYAQKGAVARRRLTCVSIANTTVTITTASTNPSTTCDKPITGPDGSATFATSDNSSSTVSITYVTLAANGALNAAATYSTPIYFQPDGRATSDAAGTTSWINMSIAVSGVSSNITVYGETGNVQ